MLTNLEFRAEVRRQLTLRGWTYKDLAKWSGLSRAVVNRYMCGNYPNDLPKEPIAKALGIEV